MGRDLDVILYGATGYSGELVARALDDAKASFAIAGRSQDKLAALSGSLATEPETLAVAVNDPDGLHEMTNRARCVLSAAGPYKRLGPPVIEACLDTGTHFGDITGEQTYLRWCAEQHERAIEADIIVANALGFDVVPSDLTCVATCEGLDAVGQLDLCIHVDRMRPSRGTRRTMATMAGEGVWYRNGAFRSASAGRFKRRFTFPDPVGARTGVFIPWGDVATAPRSTGTRTMRTFFTLPEGQARKLHWAWPITHVLSKSGRITKRLAAKADRAAPGPPADERSQVRFTMLAEATAQDGRLQRATCTGRDPYGLTGAAAALAARRIARGDVEARGVLTPSQLLDVQTWINGLTDFEMAVSRA